MGSININFAEVEGGFENMPAGVYPAVVEKVEVRESKSSDHPYLNWEYTIEDGEFEGRKQWQITSLSPKAAFRLKDHFAALGFDVETEDFNIEWDDDVPVTPGAGPLLLDPDVTGMSVNLVITIDMYEGKERNRVDEIRAIDEPKTASNGRSGPAKTTAKRKALR